LILAPEVTALVSASYAKPTAAERKILEDGAVEIIAKEITKSYKILQSHGSDSYGFRALEIRDYTLYKAAAPTSEIWQETFGTAEIRPSVKVRFARQPARRFRFISGRAVPAQSCYASSPLIFRSPGTSGADFIKIPKNKTAATIPAE
jgi:hypothetical protein